MTSLSIILLSASLANVDWIPMFGTAYVEVLRQLLDKFVPKYILTSKSNSYLVWFINSNIANIREKTSHGVVSEKVKAYTT